MFQALRTIGKDCLLLSTEFNFIQNPTSYQSVRWRRKPRWLPVAPSKMFRVPQKPKIPVEEKLEIERLYKNYKTEMKSLRLYFWQKTQKSLTGKEVIDEQIQLEEEEHQKCLKLNDEWNSKVAAMRVIRLNKERELEMERILKEVEENKIKEQERKQQLELRVKQEKENAKYYITPENIDQAIEKALSTVVDYDFALDLEGNKYVGRHTKPPKKVKRLTVEAEG